MQKRKYETMEEFRHAMTNAGIASRTRNTVSTENNYSNWTNEDIEIAISDLSVKEKSALLGRSACSIYHIMRRFGKCRKYHHWTADEIQKLQDKSRSYNSLIQELGCSAYVITYYRRLAEKGE